MEITEIPIIQENKTSKVVDYKLKPTVSYEAFYKKKNGQKGSTIRDTQWSLKIDIDHELRRGSELLKVEVLNKNKILSIYTNFIIGGVAETDETFKKSLKFMVELLRLAPGRLEVGTCYLSPYPGTDIRNNPSKYGVKLIDKDMVTGTSLGGIFIETEKLDQEDIVSRKLMFVRTMFNEMTLITHTLDIDLIKEHLIARVGGMSSGWSDYFVSDRILNTWFNFFSSGNYSDKKIESNSDSLDYLLPVRCFSLEKIDEGVMIWSLRNQEVKFTSFEEFIVRHSGGKLTVYEIASRAYSSLGNTEIVFEDVLIDVVNYINSLTQECLVINRRLV